MMNKIFLLAMLVSISGALYSTNHNGSEFNVEIFVKQYISDFNQQKDINSFFHFPVVWLVDDTSIPVMEDDTNKKLINYDKLKKSGWVKSSINDLKVIHQSKNRAFVLLDFSRLDSNNNQILRSEVMYTITKRQNDWGISIVASASPFIR
tara:strand:- start:167 stop:616 length:450 start_codon:yes stop_codon:yes gene_type:complete